MKMTLNEARYSIGKEVLYFPKHGEIEYGVITSVGNHLIFVRYKPKNQEGWTGSKGTKPSNLILKEKWQETERFRNILED